MTLDEYKDRTYHGYVTENGRHLIDVERTEPGPTERLNAPIFKTMESSAEVGRGNHFGWGHNGGGTSAAAQELLTDALGEAPSRELREEFCRDVLTFMPDEWRLRRKAVLRWVRGWHAEHPELPLPAAAALPS